MSQSPEILGSAALPAVRGHVGLDALRRQDLAKRIALLVIVGVDRPHAVGEHHVFIVDVAQIARRLAIVPLGLPAARRVDELDPVEDTFTVARVFAGVSHRAGLLQSAQRIR